MINIHHHATEPLPKLILVDTCKNIAIHANSSTLAKFSQITGNPFFWQVVNDDVGDYICSYNEFRQLYPEYFI